MLRQDSLQLALGNMLIHLFADPELGFTPVPYTQSPHGQSTVEEGLGVKKATIRSVTVRDLPARQALQVCRLLQAFVQRVPESLRPAILRSRWAPSLLFSSPCVSSMR